MTSSKSSPFKTEVATDADGFTLRVYGAERKLVGRMEVGIDDGLARVLFVHVDKTIRRAGIGTRMYERAAREACERGARLASDDRRSKYAEAFWQKQVAKKRATCIDEGGAFQFRPTGGETTKYKAWKCATFALTCPAPDSLGARRVKNARRG